MKNVYKFLTVWLITWIVINTGTVHAQLKSANDVKDNNPLMLAPNDKTPPSVKRAKASRAPGPTEKTDLGNGFYLLDNAVEQLAQHNISLAVFYFLQERIGKEAVPLRIVWISGFRLIRGAEYYHIAL